MFKSRPPARACAQRPRRPRGARFSSGICRSSAVLSAEDQQELLGHTQVFIAEKHFEGAGGLVLTEEMRVTIAGQACLLLLHRETDYYPELITIIVYPSGYTAHEERPIGGGIWEEGAEDRPRSHRERLSALVLAWRTRFVMATSDPADGEISCCMNSRTNSILRVRGATARQHSTRVATISRGDES